MISTNNSEGVSKSNSRSFTIFSVELRLRNTLSNQFKVRLRYAHLNLILKQCFGNSTHNDNVLHIMIYLFVIANNMLLKIQ